MEVAGLENLWCVSHQGGGCAANGDRRFRTAAAASGSFRSSISRRRGKSMAWAGVGSAGPCSSRTYSTLEEHQAEVR